MSYGFWDETPHRLVAPQPPSVFYRPVPGPGVLGGLERGDGSDIGSVLRAG